MIERDAENGREIEREGAELNYPVYESRTHRDRERKDDSLVVITTHMAELCQPINLCQVPSSSSTNNNNDGSNNCCQLCS